MSSHRLILFFTLFFASFSFLFGQTCLDPQARNFGKTGDCLYPAKRKKLKKHLQLPAELDENSGLILYKNSFWTHNDGGNSSSIYRIDKETGLILQKITLENAQNIDWEDITQDENAIYIGDFGNNKGKRKDLNVLKINKLDITEDSVQTVRAERIDFYYPEQRTFDRPDHNFDCEGFFAFNDQLHLFTKNRGNGKTYHYALPCSAGSYAAHLRDSLNVEGLITAADRLPSGEVALLAYTKDYKAYLWVLSGYTNDHFFAGKKQKFKLGSTMKQGQTEGLVWETPTSGYISAEKTPVTKPKIKKFKLSPINDQR